MAGRGEGFGRQTELARLALPLDAAAFPCPHGYPLHGTRESDKLSPKVTDWLILSKLGSAGDFI
jgi:hypothetical protein